VVFTTTRIVPRGRGVPARVGIVLSYRSGCDMRTPYWLLALAVGLGALVAAPAADPPGADAERIAKLVKQLGSDSPDEREKATKELEDIGAPALDALRAAAKDGDADLKTRAGALIDKVEKKAGTDKLLVPTEDKLLFKWTPRHDEQAWVNERR